MRIGITCYPTYGGSGVVATELGLELAARGHEIHFVTYAPPIRLIELNHQPELARRICYHEVEVMNYPLFDYPPYDLALATKMVEVAELYELDLLHVHYAIPHSVSAYLAQAMLAPRHLPFVTTLHGTDITLVGQDRSFLPITRFAIEQSDGVTAVSQNLLEVTRREFKVKKPIEVIPNFVNCDRYHRLESPEQRRRYAPDSELLIAHLSNFRPVKRIPDVIEDFARIRAALPARLLLIGDGPERATPVPGAGEGNQRRPVPRQAGRGVRELGSATCSCCPAIWILRPRGARGHGLRSARHCQRRRRHAGSD
jgi:N-acetyl-alpha-D-glucosaminyl L-malate synthase BshA